MSQNKYLKKIIYYKSIDGHCPYNEWLDSLDYKTKAIVENRIERIQDGLYGDHKKLSNSSLSELRFFIGKGYRVYYRDLTNVLIIIVAGSNKQDQKQVIKKAQKYLQDFFERNKNDKV